MVKCNNCGYVFKTKEREIGKPEKKRELCQHCEEELKLRKAKLQEIWNGFRNGTIVDELCVCGHSKLDHQDTLGIGHGACMKCKCKRFRWDKFIMEDEKFKAMGYSLTNTIKTYSVDFAFGDSQYSGTVNLITTDVGGQKTYEKEVLNILQGDYVHEIKDQQLYDKLKNWLLKEWMPKKGE